MQHLDNYRLVSIEVACSHADRPIQWTQHTTRTEPELIRHSRAVANLTCDDKSPAHQDQHVVRVSDLDDDGQVVAHA